MKLDPVLFPDSSISRKLSCGRTKSEALVENVLAPKSVETVVEDLSSKAKFFSLSTDASNMKNRKLFPVCVQYFCVDGIHKKLLDFVEQNDESSAEVADMLTTSLSTHGLNIEHLVGFSADNASVNYGCRKSVYTALQSLNPNIVKANCNAHIVHNTLRKVVDVLDCDVETIVTAVYSHFSISANRRTELQEFFNFVDLEYHDMLRHVSTRWLSLGPAIERLLQSWPALISYFKSIGADCPKRLSKAIGLHTDNEEEDGDVKLNVTKAGLYFARNLCNVFQQAVLALEGDDVTFCELFPIMSGLRAKLTDRLTDKYFGEDISTILENEDMPPAAKRKTEINFCAGLQRAVSYLQQWFDFTDTSIAFVLQSLSLIQMPKFQDVKAACMALKLSKIVDIDSLYDEFSMYKSILQSIVDGKTKQSVSGKWVAFFAQCNTVPPNLFTVVSCMLSLPGSNAFPERVFSLMNAKWRGDRNRMLVSLVKSELQTFINYDLDCRRFYAFALAEPKLLQAAASNEKYVWKNKAKKAKNVTSLK
jgi:hypothetical protein